jgi:hypothetical protein
MTTKASLNIVSHNFICIATERYKCTEEHLNTCVNNNSKKIVEIQPT